MQESGQCGSTAGVVPVVELERLVASLQESDRRKDEFLATVAHELRNPLACVRNAVHILQAEMPSKPEMQWAADLIARQSGQMARLIDDLTDISQIRRGNLNLRMRRVKLDEALRHAMEEMRPLIEAGAHELIYLAGEQALQVEADLTRLAQVFSNLLANAAKYTPRGGRIEVAVRRESNDVIVSVRDSGIGISKPMLERIFEPFVQLNVYADRSARGLGIGLALARQLVRLHDGTIEAYSEGIGKGTEFRVRLKVLSDGLIPADIAMAPLRMSRLRARVLIADDHSDSAASLGILLKGMGCEVRTASNGRLALQLAEEFQPDVALLDVLAPTLDGCEVARAIRSRPWGESVGLIAVTGWSDAENRERAMQSGFDHYWVKPIDLVALTNLLSRVGEGRGPYTAQRSK